MIRQFPRSKSINGRKMHSSLSLSVRVNILGGTKESKRECFEIQTDLISLSQHVLCMRSRYITFSRAFTWNLNYHFAANLNS